MSDIWIYNLKIINEKIKNEYFYTFKKIYESINSYSDTYSYSDSTKYSNK